VWILGLSQAEEGQIMKAKCDMLNSILEMLQSVKVS
jgi:hypothetical protein